MADGEAGASWPAVEFESRPWRVADSYTSRAQRRLHQGDYRAAVPPRIAEVELNLPAQLIAESEDALREIVRFDHYASERLGSSVEHAPMSSILLRTESSASSQIENLTVGARALALAELGAPTTRNASIVSANVRAMEAALEVGSSIGEASVLQMHRSLMESNGDPFPGQWRTQQVWIGGSDIGPHRAAFVPPHHDRLPGALADLFEFAARSDLPVIPHIAVTHAQFETLHPFTDGNGRTGRAIVHAMLRRAEVTERVTVPLSAGLLTDTAGYFRSLDAYRAGDVEAIVRSLTAATFHAVEGGRRLVDELSDVRTEYTDRVVARSDSVVWKLLDALVAQPVVDNAYVRNTFAVSEIAAQRAIDKLTEVGIVHQTSKGRRNRVWQAEEILAALDDFADGIRRVR